MMQRFHAIFGRGRWRTAAFFGLLCLAASPALAQTMDTVRPPRGGIWIGWILAVLLAVMVVMVNLKPSKRGHQD